MVYIRSPKWKYQSKKDLLYERAKLAYEYHTKQGMTLQQIGMIFGLTRERVRQIIDKYEESLKQLGLGLDKKK